MTERPDARDEPLDQLEAAIAFAIREALRLDEEREAALSTLPADRRLRVVESEQQEGRVA